MRHRRQSYAITALLAAVGLVFAGCSEQSTTQTGPSEAPTTSAQADLSLSASQSSLAGQPGTVFGYDLLAENAGPDAATSVVIEQSFGASVELVEVDPQSGSCTVSGSSFTCELGTLPAGVERSAHVVVRIPEAMEGELEASVRSPVVDPADGNNAARISAKVSTEGPDPHPKNANPSPTDDSDAPFAPTAVVEPATTITNGTVRLGINQAGQLAVGSDGLRYLPTGGEAIRAGCDCEGWGVGDAGTGVSGFANEDFGGPSSNVTIEEFTTTASTALSRVIIDNGSGSDVFRVTHDYHPSASSFLFEATVTIENVSGATLSDVRYGRVMDWDVPPTGTDEFVTIQGTAAEPTVIFSSNDPFSTSGDPLAGPTDLGATGDFVDFGPDDQGARFDMSFGSLASGQSVTFKIYYGAAGAELDALGAVGTVEGDVYSFGQPNTQGGPDQGTPNTFVFAYVAPGEDGGPVPPPPPGEVCEVVTFNDLGGHASRLDGFPLAFDDISLRVKQGGPRSEQFTALYDTDNVGGPDFDLEWDGPRAECPECEGLGNVLIIPDVNFIEHGGQGNSIDGGWIIMNGFTPDVWRLASMTVIDSDATLWDPLTAVHPHFNPYEVSVDGEQIGLSEVTNREGDVQTLIFEEEFSPPIDTEARVLIPEDPGAIDNLQFCRPEDVTAEELITNGGFEDGAAGWTVTDLGSGSFVIDDDDGTTPTSGNATVGPASGGSYMVSDQTGPGTHALTQEFTVPAGVESVTLSFDMFVNDWDAGPIVDPIGLDHTGPNNQHGRVDVLTAAAGTFDTGAGVVTNVFTGIDPGADPNPYTHYEVDLTAALGGGGSFVLRFAETDNQSFFNMGVDNVSIVAVGSGFVSSLEAGALGGFSASSAVGIERITIGADGSGGLVRGLDGASRGATADCTVTEDGRTVYRQDCRQ